MNRPASLRVRFDMMAEFLFTRPGDMRDIPSAECLSLPRTVSDDFFNRHLFVPFGPFDSGLPDPPLFFEFSLKVFGDRICRSFPRALDRIFSRHFPIHLCPSADNQSDWIGGSCQDDNR